MSGVNLVGYLRTESGVGEAARRTLRALRRAGVRVALEPVAIPMMGPLEGSAQAAYFHQDLDRDYPRLARAARTLAEEHFDSDKVLSRLLERIEAAP